MKTSTRRQFLATLGAVAAAPLIAAAAKTPPNTVLKGPVDVHTFQGIPVRVEGAAIKVPSNRLCVTTKVTRISGREETSMYHTYTGDWDGTFRLEHGCTNPAFVLADLYERTDEEPDWVVADRSVPACVVCGPMVMTGVRQLLKPRLNWQMIYDWGVWADELTNGDTAGGRGRPRDHAPWEMTEPGARVWHLGRTAPRFTVNVACHTHEDMVQLRETLRMHCLRWQSTDPRYRTSYPGTPCPGDRGRAAEEVRT